LVTVVCSSTAAAVLVTYSLTCAIETLPSRGGALSSYTD